MAGGERVRDAQGRADHEHLLADLHLVGVAELCGLHAVRDALHLQQRDVGRGFEAMTSPTGS